MVHNLTSSGWVHLSWGLKRKVASGKGRLQSQLTNGHAKQRSPLSCGVKWGHIRRWHGRLFSSSRSSTLTWQDRNFPKVTQDVWQLKMLISSCGKLPTKILTSTIFPLLSILSFFNPPEFSLMSHDAPLLGGKKAHQILTTVFYLISSLLSPCSVCSALVHNSVQIICQDASGEDAVSGSPINWHLWT